MWLPKPCGAEVAFKPRGQGGVQRMWVTGRETGATHRAHNRALRPRGVRRAADTLGGMLEDKRNYKSRGRR